MNQRNTIAWKSFNVSWIRISLSSQIPINHMWSNAYSTSNICFTGEDCQSDRGKDCMLQLEAYGVFWSFITESQVAAACR